MSRRIWKRLIIAVIVALTGGESYQAYINGVPVGEEIIGVVLHVTDGDTFRVNGIKIRIWGVDAPEIDQRGYVEAEKVLQEKALLKQVSCVIRDRDRYGRIVAQCFRDKEDIGGAIIASGWARDDRRHSKGYYLKEEMIAKRAHLGLWGKV